MFVANFSFLTRFHFVMDFDGFRDGRERLPNDHVYLTLTNAHVRLTLINAHVRLLLNNAHFYQTLKLTLSLHFPNANVSVTLGQI
jgi:hypothetical protein